MAAYTPRLGDILITPSPTNPMFAVPLIVTGIGPDGSIVGTAFIPFATPQHIGPMFAYPTESEAIKSGLKACWMPGSPYNPPRAAEVDPTQFIGR